MNVEVNKTKVFPRRGYAYSLHSSEFTPVYRPLVTGLLYVTFPELVLPYCNF